MRGEEETTWVSQAPCPSPTSRQGLHLGTRQITIPPQDQSQFVSLKQYEKSSKTQEIRKPSTV